MSVMLRSENRRPTSKLVGSIGGSEHTPLLSTIAGQGQPTAEEKQGARHCEITLLILPAIATG
jgi:dihydroxyacetone kinase